jgi:alpha-beta hydrolase superfamily lysophospholipase
MRKDLECGEDTIIVGHSSGAAAAMRFCESYKVAGEMKRCS